LLLADFRSRFPEFEKAPDALVNSKLSDASDQLDHTVWGSILDQGVGYLAAHLLSRSPWGQQARLDAKDRKTTYLEAFQELQARVGAGGRLAGAAGLVTDVPPIAGTIL
jgi:Protein of unknown function (DUF4054)